MKLLYVKLCFFIIAYSSFTYGQSIFRTACNGAIERLDSLLVNQNIDTADHRGMGLLHWAVACRQKEVFAYLVDRGVRINQKNHLGATPMHIAVRYDRRSYFELLKNAQPDSTWVRTIGPGLFEPAILSKRHAFIDTLVANRIDVNSTNQRGSTPLEIARRIKADSIAQQLIFLGADSTKLRSISAYGPYMGSQTPDTIPKLFAPNFISTEEYEFGSVFNKKGDEFYYGVDVIGRNEIRYSRRIDGQWTAPIVVLAHDRYSFNDPFLSPDEQRLYFISRMPYDQKGENKKDHDIWYVQKEKKGWSLPINAGPAINSNASEYYISFTNSGRLYFASNKATFSTPNDNHDIYYSDYKNGAFQKAIRLGSAVNSPNYEADVFVDPNERYLIFCAMREGGHGRGDLYISFKNKHGRWTRAQNLGKTINTEGHELCPFVTADGNYLFYTSKEDIYWVSTAIFTKFKNAVTN